MDFDFLWKRSSSSRAAFRFATARRRLDRGRRGSRRSARVDAVAGNAVLDGIARAYVFVFRGTPPRADLSSSTTVSAVSGNP
jgi:hypothetical protein